MKMEYAIKLNLKTNNNQFKRIQFSRIRSSGRQ